MRYRPLGRTGLTVSELSYGAARGAIDAPDDFSASIEAVIDSGINLIDTAEHYSGSEEAIGAALVGHDDVLVQTKHMPYSDFSPEATYIGTPEGVVATAEQSLRRLRRDRLDIFLGHGMRTAASYQQFMSDGCCEAMVKLKAQGKVRFIGISELSEADGTHEVLKQAVPSGVFDVVMLTVNFLLQTAIDDILPLCRAHGVGTVVMMPLNQPSVESGLVSIDAAHECIRRHIDHGNLPDAPPYTDEDVLDFLKPYSIPEAALRFVLAQEVDSCCVGARTPGRVRENLAAVDPPYLDTNRLARLQSLFGGISWQMR
jgi:aryl-alcohol dehydrogenase-like predicted oxidoreductase